MKITMLKETARLEDVKAGKVFKFCNAEQKEKYPSVYIRSNSKLFIDLSSGTFHKYNSDMEYANDSDEVEIVNAELVIQ